MLERDAQQLPPALYAVPLGDVLYEGKRGAKFVREEALGDLQGERVHLEARAICLRARLVGAAVRARLECARAAREGQEA